MGQIQSLGDFLNMMRRRIVLILGAVLLGTAFSVLWTLGQPRIYEAVAVAQIENPAVRDTGAAAVAQGDSGVEHRLRLLEQRLMARDNLLAMVERYGLYGDTDLSAGLKVSTLRESVRITQITDPNAGFGGARVPTGMMITVNDTSPEVAAAMANDFLDQMVSLNRDRRSSAAEQNLTFFQSEAARVEAEMSALEARIAAFKEDNAAFLPQGITAQREELATLRTTQLELEQKLIELEATSTRQRAEALERQTTLLKQQQKLIDSRIAEIEANIASAPEVDRQFGILTRQLDQLKEQYGVIIRRATEAEMGQQLTEQDQFERIEVLENALVPENPVSGSRKKKVALGAVLSLILGMGVAFLLEVMNPVIRTPAQLERQLNVKAVIAIPKLTTEQGRRRKKMLWATALAILLAALWAGWAVLKEALTVLGGMIAGRMRRA
ncbi:MAG: chain-length determining protein [Paracoccaceae bacterium]